jgi:uncharacterized membrane protein
MATLLENSSFHLPSGRRRIVALCFAAAGFLVSCYLAWSSLTGDAIAGCGEGAVFNCNHVLQSRFAKIYGLPISVPAALTMGLIVCCLAPSDKKEETGSLVSCCFPLALSAAAASAAWFIWLQCFQIGKLCLFCLIVHSCSLILTVLVFSIPGNLKRPVQRIAPAILAVLLVAVIQWNSPEPKSFEVTDEPAAQEFEQLDMEF